MEEWSCGAVAHQLVPHPPGQVGPVPVLQSGVGLLTADPTSNTVTHR